MDVKTALFIAIRLLKQHKIQFPNLDAEILLSHILKKPREYILTHPDHKLNRSFVKRYELCVTRRAKNEPIAYITGHKEFYGLDFFVNKNVLVPRPETELMIDEALKEAEPLRFAEANRRGSASLCIIDVGTGSGCVIISIAKLLKDKIRNPKSEIRYLATDISKQTLIVAKKNAKTHNVHKKIKFLHGNLLELIIKKISKFKIQNSKFIITANLPYLTPAQIKNSPSIQHEPKLALTAGADGLKYYKQLFKQVKKIKNQKLRIKILIEIDPNQIKKIKQLIKRELPNSKIQIKKDLRGLNRLAKIEYNS